MTPTTNGRHCASCPHEVVDFSRMSEAEVVAWLARPAVGTIRGYFRAGQFASSPPAPRWRHWVVAAVALLGPEPLLTACQTTAPTTSTPAGTTEQADTHAEAPKGQVTIRGRVLDDSTGLGVPGAKIFLGDTKYGAVTDDQGNFSFMMLSK